jgi:hypothetical protein
MPFSNDKPHAVNDYKTYHLAVPTVIFRDQAVNYFDKCTDTSSSDYGYKPFRSFGTWRIQELPFSAQTSNIYNLDGDPSRAEVRLSCLTETIVRSWERRTI